MKYHENPSCGSGVVPRRRTDGKMDRQTQRQTGSKKDMTKLIVAFRTFVNKPIENQIQLPSHLYVCFIKICQLRWPLK